MEIIAEIGQNHNGDINLACEMIHRAKESGADVVKFQVYNARELFPKVNNPWLEYNYKTELSKNDVFRLAKECQKANVEFMASVFDVERVDWLEEVGMRRYKIASRSIYDQKLIARLCQLNKPLIVALGMWHEAGFPQLSTQSHVDFLYCVSKYPTAFSEMNLKKVDFNVYSGLSDHTIGISCLMAALSRGARIIEKHFTLDKNMHGPDHACSMTPQELKTIHYFRHDLKELL